MNGFTGEMRAALLAHGVKQVLIAYDNDPAGNEAAVKLASSLAADGIATFRVLFPAGMDANGYLCQWQSRNRRSVFAGWRGCP